MFNDSAALQPRQGVGTTQLAQESPPGAPSLVAASVRTIGRVDNDRPTALDDVAPVARSSFAPPAAGSRVEVIVAARIADARVDVAEPRAAEFGDGAGAVDLGVDEIPAADRSPEDTPVDEVLPDGPSADDAPVGEGPADHAPADAAAADDAAVDDAAGDDAVRVDRAPQLGDDFWTGAASEESVPTRKVVYGARSGDDPSGRRGWVKSVRRRRR